MWPPVSVRGRRQPGLEHRGACPPELHGNGEYITKIELTQSGSVMNVAVSAINFSP